jgi:hypothetical protein
MTSLMLLVEHEIRPKSEEGASAKMPVEDPIIFKSGIFIGWIFPAFAKVTFWNIGANFTYQLRSVALNVVEHGGGVLRLR